MLKKFLVAALVSSLVAANVAAAKIASIGPAIVPAGFVGIAFAFLFTDILSERYGKDEARGAVNAAVGSLAVAWTVLYASVAMPSAPFYTLAEPYAAIIGQSGHIILASILTLAVSQNIDVSAFHRIKQSVTHKWARNLGSTTISQAVDTSLFIGLGFVIFPAILGGSPMALPAAASLAAGQYAVKIGVAAIDTPIFYALTRGST